MESRNNTSFPSHDLLLQVINMLDDGVLIMNEDLSIHYVNEGFLHMTGYAKEEMDKDFFQLLKGADTSTEALQVIERAIAQKTTEETEWVSYRKNGKKFLNRTRIKSVYIEEEKKHYTVVIMQDITNAKVSAEKIKFYENKITAFSTPILPMLDHVFLIPIVGSVDEERLQNIFDDVTEMVYSTQIRTLILDLTGLEEITEDTLHGLFTLHHILELVESELIITGIPTEWEEKANAMDIDPHRFRIFDTVKDALSSLESVSTSHYLD